MAVDFAVVTVRDASPVFEGCAIDAKASVTGSINSTGLAVDIGPYEYP